MVVRHPPPISKLARQGIGVGVVRPEDPEGAAHILADSNTTFSINGDTSWTPDSLITIFEFETPFLISREHVNTISVMNSDMELSLRVKGQPPRTIATFDGVRKFTFFGKYLDTIVAMVGYEDSPLGVQADTFRG